MSVTGIPETLHLLCGPVTAVDLALFAAASGDHNPLHLDAEVARAAGFERPVVHGMLTMAYAGRLVTRHFGPGSLARLHGELEDVTGGLARYRVQATNQNGTALMAGEALVRAKAPA
jgi:hypothetical protein